MVILRGIMDELFEVEVLDVVVFCLLEHAAKGLVQELGNQIERRTLHSSLNVSMKNSFSLLEVNC